MIGAQCFMQEKHHSFPPMNINHDRKNNQIFDTVSVFFLKKDEQVAHPLDKPSYHRSEQV